MGQYGSINDATATVTSNQGTPDGEVGFFVNGDRFATRQLDNDGSVSATLPRGLRAQDDHVVQARFVSDCPWNNSRSPRKSYSVFRADTATDTAARNVRQARFTGTVNRLGEGDGFDPRGGRMEFTVQRAGQSNVIRSKTVDVNDDGFAAVDMANLGDGSYNVQSRYLGTNSFRRSQGTGAYQVS
jgi:hypothetical protein